MNVEATQILYIPMLQLVNSQHTLQAKLVRGVVDPLISVAGGDVGPQLPRSLTRQVAVGESGNLILVALADHIHALQGAIILAGAEHDPLVLDSNVARLGIAGGL